MTRCLAHWHGETGSAFVASAPCSVSRASVSMVSVGARGARCAPLTFLTSKGGIRLMLFDGLVPSPDWLNSGDTAWQLTSATLVGLMSVPGLAILYAGLMKRKWALNSALMVLYAFAMTLVVWTLFAYSMSFGKPIPVGPGFVGIPWPVLFSGAEQGQASIPLLDGLIPALKFPGSALVYFQV